MMGNYKINCQGMDESKKKLIQDAFFKLGYFWSGCKKGEYNYLSSGQYYIYHRGTLSFTTDDVYHFNRHNNQELTFNELMKLANMEEFMEQKTFTKSDLKTGMVVKQRGGCFYTDKYSGLNLVVGQSFVQSDEYEFLYSYEEDLTSTSYGNHFDIVEVFEVVKVTGSIANITNWDLKSIWKRPEPISAQQQAILDLEAKQQELIDAAKSIAADIAKLKGV